VRLSCRVGGKPGLIVGYAPGGSRNKIHAIIVVEGELKKFALKDIELLNVPEGLGKKEKPLHMHVVAAKETNGERA
jgi:hypothetical protein